MNSDAPSRALPVEAADVLDAAADLIEREGWTSDHHWLSSDISTGFSPQLAGTATTTNYSVAPHPNFNPDGFCIVDALLKVHPQGKFWGSPLRSWQSMKEPHCGRLGTLLMDAIGPRCTGYPAGLIQWNDERGRTSEEVVSVLRAASESARKDGSATKTNGPSDV